MTVLARLTDGKPLSVAAQALCTAVSDLFPHAVAVRLSRAEGRWACSDLTAPEGDTYELIPFGEASGGLSEAEQSRLVELEAAFADALSLSGADEGRGRQWAHVQIDFEAGLVDDLGG